MVVNGCRKYNISNKAIPGGTVSSGNEAYTVPSFVMVARLMGQRHAQKRAKEQRWSPSWPSKRHRQKTPERLRRPEPEPKAGTQSTPSLPSAASPSKEWFRHLQHKAHNVMSSLDTLMADLTREDWKNRSQKADVKPVELAHLTKQVSLPQLQKLPNKSNSPTKEFLTDVDSDVSSKLSTNQLIEQLLETSKKPLNIGAKVLVDIQMANLVAGTIVERATHPVHLWEYSVDLITGDTKTNIPHKSIFVERPGHKSFSRKFSAAGSSAIGNRRNSDLRSQNFPRLSTMQRIISANFMDVWQAELLKSPDSPKTRLRCALLQKCGSVTEMMKSLDCNSNGFISMIEFVQNMTTLGFDPVKISGERCRTFGELFRLFDASKDGVIDLAELFGIDQKHVQRANWEMMSTMEQWNHWCRNTVFGDTNQPLCAKWNCSESRLRNIAERRKHEIQVQTSKEEMRQWFRRGERRPMIVARYLRDGLESEVLAKQAKRDLADRARTVQNAIQSLSDNNKVLLSTREVYMDVIEKNANKKRGRETALENEKKEELEQEKGTARVPEPKFNISSVFQTGKPTGDELIYFFSEMHLDPMEVETRRVAREMGIPLPVAEVMREAFSLHDTDQSGIIDLEKFKNLLPLLQGRIDLTENRLNALWRAADLNSSGGLNFEEFIEWYCRNFGVPTSTSRFGSWCTKKRT